MLRWETILNCPWMPKCHIHFTLKWFMEWYSYKMIYFLQLYRYVNTSLPITYVNSNRNKSNFVLSIVERKTVKEIFSLGLGFICFTKPSLVKVFKTLCICLNVIAKLEVFSQEIEFCICFSLEIFICNLLIHIPSCIEVIQTCAIAKS